MDTAALRDVTGMLEDAVREAERKCRTCPSYASTMDDKLVSPIPLTQFPFIRSFYPRPLITIMVPRQRAGFSSSQHPSVSNLKSSTDESWSGVSNPFIYSPFAPGQKNKRKEVTWVEGDPAEIALSIGNQLPFELRVEKMVSLLCLCVGEVCGSPYGRTVYI